MDIKDLRENESIIEMESIFQKLKCELCILLIFFLIEWKEQFKSVLGMDFELLGINTMLLMDTSQIFIKQAKWHFHLIIYKNSRSVEQHNYPFKCTMKSLNYHWNRRDLDWLGVVISIQKFIENPKTLLTPWIQNLFSFSLAKRYVV